MKRNSLTLEDDIKDEKKKNKEGGYFCSELIAKAYKKAGFLPLKKSSCCYWPVSFSQSKNLVLLNDAKLSNEMTVLL